MILVDTSIWVEHLRRSNTRLEGLLARHLLLGHPFVVGELALGGIKPDVIRSLLKLPQAAVAKDTEVLGLIGRYHLAGRKIGYLDCHLLASSLLMGDTTIWTLDKSMQAVAEDLDILQDFR